MDDLISRKALLDDLCQDREEGTFEFNEKQAEAADKLVRYVVGRIETQPLVPAAPLDKLCEWLAELYGSPCQLTDDCDSPCMLEGVGQMKGAECWYYLIRTKVLEKLDGGDADV